MRALDSKVEEASRIDISRHCSAEGEHMLLVFRAFVLIPNVNPGLRMFVSMVVGLVLHRGVKRRMAQVF